MVQVGFIGTGSWAQRLAVGVAATGDASISRCWSPTAASRGRFAAAFGCEPSVSAMELVRDPSVDAVVIATPHSTHRELVELAAGAGRHVFVEKPLTNTVEDGLRCVEAAERASVVLQVGHHRRRSPALRRLRELMDTDVMGVVSLAEAVIMTPGSLRRRDTWRADPVEAPLGAVTALGVHGVDNLLHLLGDAVGVTCMSARPVGLNPIDDVTSLLLQFSTGAIGHVGSSMVATRTTNIAVHGTRRSGWSTHDGTTLRLQDESGGLHDVDLPDVDPIIDQMRGFVASIRDGSAVEVSGHEALRVVAVMEAAIRSRRTGGHAEIVRPT